MTITEAQDKFKELWMEYEEEYPDFWQSSTEDGMVTIFWEAVNGRQGLPAADVIQIIIGTYYATKGEYGD